MALVWTIIGKLGHSAMSFAATLATIVVLNVVWCALKGNLNRLNYLLALLGLCVPAALGYGLVALSANFTGKPVGLGLLDFVAMLFGVLVGVAMWQEKVR